MPIDALIRESPTRPPDSGDRLNGWRDVAAHVGKSVRTAQRWEKIFNLPVHRITTPNGEVVYAFRTELDAWLRSRDTKVLNAPNSVIADGVAGRTRLLLAGSAIGVALSALALGILLFGVPFAARTARTLRVVAGDRTLAGPAGWRVDGGQLRVYNARDQHLWDYQFPFALDERAYAKEGATGPPLVVVADLDNDGDKEVLFIARGKDPADSTLYCFENTGAVRFSVQPRRRVRFGEQDYAPPFDLQQVLLTQDGHRYTLWLVARHHAWFPSVLQKISHTGDVIAEYWNDGRIDSLRDTWIGSRHVMLVAGTNAEYSGPSLAVLDYDAPGGAAPADDPRFRCADCGQRFPIAAFAIPFTSVWSEMNLAATVDQILVAKSGYITLALHGSRIVEGGGHARLNVIVTFDSLFEVLDIQANDLASASAATVKTSKSTPRRDAHLRMFPVVRWLDGRQPPLPSKPPNH